MPDEVWPVKEGGEVVYIEDASAAIVTFKPHMKLPESAKLHVAKEGRGPEIMHCLLSVECCQLGECCRP